MSELKPAATLASAASKPYPNDSDDYRRARTALLAEEIDVALDARAGMGSIPMPALVTTRCAPEDPGPSGCAHCGLTRRYEAAAVDRPRPRLRVETEPAVGGNAAANSGVSRPYASTTAGSS